jgi:hypothetical protein
VAGLTPGRAREIGAAARRRALAEHTYDQRALRVEAVLEELQAGSPAPARLVAGGQA